MLRWEFWGEKGRISSSCLVLEVLSVALVILSLSGDLIDLKSDE